MSSNRRPIASLTMSRKDGDTWKNFSVLSIWPTDHAGLYSISPDKGNDRYPPIGLIDAIKAFAGGARFSIRVTSESQPRGQSSERRGNDDFGGSYGSSEDPDIPFSPRGRRREW